MDEKLTVDFLIEYLMKIKEAGYGDAAIVTKNHKNILDRDLSFNYLTKEVLIHEFDIDPGIIKKVNKSYKKMLSAIEDFYTEVGL